MRILALTLSLFLFSSNIYAKELNYNLKPLKVTENVYAFIGSMDFFDRKNGGNIVNTGFIIGTDGVIVIDSGPSLLYGQQMKKAIATVTPKPVKQVIITHHHPDHFLGNEAFLGSDIYALPETIEAIKVEGNGLLENMFKMAGDWMLETDVVLPNKTVAVSKATLSGRELRFIPLNGHTQGDLVIMDEKTGVMFTGDLAFYMRTATTPHATLKNWYLSLDELQNVAFHKIVPGHGPIDKDGHSLRQTLDYLQWLEATLNESAANGMEMTEIMAMETPEKYRSLRLHREEFHRSIAHLWPDLVKATLPSIPNQLD